MPDVRSIHVELVHDAAADVGESPVWDAHRRRLWWTDLLRGELHAFDLLTGPEEPLVIGQSLGFVTPTADDDVLLSGSRDGFGRIARQFEVQASVERDQSGRRMNDGKCDRQGRAWGGTMDEATRTDGCLYRLDAGWRLTCVRDDLRVPNGLAWSVDGERMYITDSDEATVEAWRYDPERGHPSQRLHSITFTRGDGQPDGITVDSEDCIWVALWGGGAVRRYSPDGELLLEVPVPSTLVTSLAFGGDDLGDLYITTARFRLSREQLAKEPHAGGIFRCRPGVHGFLPDAYVF